MLINLLYSKKQLIKKDIKEYLKRISTLIRRNEIKKIKERIIFNYKKINKETIKVTQKYKEDSIKLNEFNKKKRKYFKCKKVGYI